MNLQTAISTLRLRLGEVDEGFWTDDDLKTCLNQAQRLTATDVSTSDYPWAVISKVRVPVASGAEHYVVPTDFMSIESVAHFKRDYEPRKMIKTPIKNLRLNNRNYNYDSQYQFYEVRGKAPSLIAEGAATGGSNTSISDNDYIDATKLQNVRDGDIIFNENDDDASAILSQVSVDTANNMFMAALSDWSGGQQQGFNYGDRYRIISQENTRKQLWVYPIQTFKNPSIYSGVFSPITVPTNTQIVAMDIEIRHVDFHIDPEPTPNADLDVRIKIVQDATPTDTAQDVAVLGHTLESLTDTIHFGPKDMKPFLLRSNGRYSVELHVNGQEASIFPENKITLYYEDNQNFLEIGYVPYPRELKNDRSICELEEFMWEAMFRKAKQLAIEKQVPTHNILTALQNDYESEILKAKTKLKNREESGMDSNIGLQFNEHDHLSAQGLSMIHGHVSEIF